MRRAWTSLPLLLLLAAPAAGLAGLAGDLWRFEGPAIAVNGIEGGTGCAWLFGARGDLHLALLERGEDDTLALAFVGTHPFFGLTRVPCALARGCVGSGDPVAGWEGLCAPDVPNNGWRLRPNADGTWDFFYFATTAFQYFVIDAATMAATPP